MIAGVRLFRSVWRSVLVVLLLSAAVLDGQFRKTFLGLKVGPAGAVWVHGWCRLIVRALGLRVTADGPVPVAGERGLAVVSNHLSYLDILLYASVRPFCMVAKTEVRGWPLIGWITAQAGTVYVQRGTQRAEVKGGQTQTYAQVNAMMAEAFASGLPVMFFPEGTTTDGEEIVPFRRGLYHSVIDGGVPMKAAAVSYALEGENGGATVGQDVCYWGDMEFGPHMFGFLGLRGVSARMKFGAEEVTRGDRFAMAAESRDRVVVMYEGIRGGVERVEEAGYEWAGGVEVGSGG
jgi:1-acyl-sn-glycerol-3-phosphate acyltransferase